MHGGQRFHYSCAHGLAAQVFSLTRDDHHRLQQVFRVLEDHAHLRAAELAALVRAHIQQIDSVEA